MGVFNVFIQVGGVADSQIATVRTVLDAQLATWQSSYPQFQFVRGKIDWKED